MDLKNWIFHFFMKKFFTDRPFVIGFKRENSPGIGENIQIVKMELWAMEKACGIFNIVILLPVLNRIELSLTEPLKKAQGKEL